MLYTLFCCCCRNVTQLMKDDTVLFVFGDHGMTRTGDHGGDSEDELTAGLFVYSPAQITASSPPSPVSRSLFTASIDLSTTSSRSLIRVYTSVPMGWCAHDWMCPCIDVLMDWCAHAPVCPWSDVPMQQCAHRIICAQIQPSVPIDWCAHRQMCAHAQSNVPAEQCAHASMCPWSDVSMQRCAHGVMYLCSDVPTE